MDRKSRKRFSKEFKLEAVNRSNESGKSVAQVARELDIGVYQLHRWRKESEENTDQTTSSAKKSSNQNLLDENKALKKALKRAQEERDILKKSLIFFAKDQPENSDS